MSAACWGENSTWRRSFGAVGHLDGQAAAQLRQEAGGEHGLVGFGHGHRAVGEDALLVLVQRPRQRPEHQRVAAGDGDPVGGPPQERAAGDLDGVVAVDDGGGEAEPSVDPVHQQRGLERGGAERGLGYGTAGGRTAGDQCDAGVDGAAQGCPDRGVEVVEGEVLGEPTGGAARQVARFQNGAHRVQVGGVQLRRLTDEISPGCAGAHPVAAGAPSGGAHPQLRAVLADDQRHRRAAGGLLLLHEGLEEGAPRGLRAAERGGAHAEDEGDGVLAVGPHGARTGGRQDAAVQVDAGLVPAEVAAAHLAGGQRPGSLDVVDPAQVGIVGPARHRGCAEVEGEVRVREAGHPIRVGRRHRSGESSPLR